MGTNNLTSTVYLDHLIPRTSTLFATPQLSDDFKQNLPTYDDDRKLPYREILSDDGWFQDFSKPDFQRETNAWTPKQCIEFLESVVKGWIVPSIILWNNPDNGITYVLDGAHRLSVIRAWMINDWGDKAPDGYYIRRDPLLIKEVAQATRKLVEDRIGSFKQCKEARDEEKALSKQGIINIHQVLGEKLTFGARFYSSVVDRRAGLTIQWATGDYEVAAQSFIRINQGGQTLRDWERELIESRRGSLARTIMAIAGGGTGHYWPRGLPEDPKLTQILETFPDIASRIHDTLFEPPIKLPPDDINNAPFLDTPRYFPKHKYLGELLPVLAGEDIPKSKSAQKRALFIDVDSPSEAIIWRGEKILSSALDKLEHLSSNSKKSLSVVPLFYWYNLQGDSARGLFYGFIYWLTSGSDNDIMKRKQILCGNRDRFEAILFEMKTDIASLQEGGGAGLSTLEKAAKFFQQLLKLLHSHPNVAPENLENEVRSILRELGARLKEKRKKSSNSPTFKGASKNQVMIRELFGSSMRCYICGGVLDPKRPKEIDHVKDRQFGGATHADNGKPVHPFCNNPINKDWIKKYKTNSIKVEVPSFDERPVQLEMNFENLWGKDEEFPDWTEDDEDLEEGIE